MNYLAENSLPIWMGGAIALTMALVVFLQTRSNSALATMGAIAAIVAALLALESWIETPREAVERTLYELANAVEANDVAGTLHFISPNSAPNATALRRDVNTLMPQVRIERARILGTPEIEISEDGNKAIVKCRGFILAVQNQGGIKGGGEDQFTMEWIRSGDRWLLNDYVSQKNWGRALRR